MILITGGLGYIGLALASALTKAGRSVILGTRKINRTQVISEFGQIRIINWHDAESLLAACSGVSQIIHASGINAADCSSDPVAALAFNGLATGRLIEAAADRGVRGFIYLSTAHVYAEPLIGKFDEETCPRNLSPYASSNYAGEILTRQLCEKYNLHYLVLRVSNVFGSALLSQSSAWNLLVNNLCRQAAETGEMSESAAILSL